MNSSFRNPFDWETCLWQFCCVYVLQRVVVKLCGVSWLTKTWCDDHWPALCLLLQSSYCFYTHPRRRTVSHSHIGATLYVTVVTCQHHFFKVEFAALFSSNSKFDNIAILRWITAEILLLFKCLCYMYSKEQGCIFSYKNTNLSLYFGVLARKSYFSCYQKRYVA